MGTLNTFNLQDFRNKFRCSVFVETGTGKGNGLGYALQFLFKENHSIEIDDNLFNEVKEQFKNYNVNLHKGISKEVLENIIPTIPQSEPILFFLDAHFPEGDFGELSHVESTEKYDENLCWPLLEEIKTIKKHRDISKDCFIIDDLRVYETDLQFESGPCPDPRMVLEKHKSLILDEFRSSHNCLGILKHEGYLIATPAGKESHIYF